MAKLTVQEAADISGKSKATITRAMKSGRLSFELNEQDEKVIDMSELERVYAPFNVKKKSSSEDAVRAELQRAQDMLEVERIKMRVRGLEDQLHMTQQQLEDMKEQRDQWQKQAQQILITSQVSQKQAEELKQELREREARERAARQRQMEERLRRQAQNQNPMPAKKQSSSNVADMSGYDRHAAEMPIWTKILQKLRA